MTDIKLKPLHERVVRSGDYWVDQYYRNKVAVRIAATHEKAVEFLSTLIDCRDCVNCYKCINCIKCNNCYLCINCTGCISSAQKLNGTDCFDEPGHIACVLNTGVMQ